MLSKDEKDSLSSVRFDHARDCLVEAQELLQLNRYKGAANRSYYAVFHAIRSVLALDGIDRRKHSGVISEFQRLYIKTGIFDKEFSDIIGDQFEHRTSSDYDDFYIISKSEAVELVMGAERFLDAVGLFLEQNR